MVMTPKNMKSSFFWIFFLEDDISNIGIKQAHCIPLSFLAVEGNKQTKQKKKIYKIILSSTNLAHHYD